MQAVEVKSLAELRAWLAQNHGQDASVWLVTWKKHTPFALSYSDVVDELLCWGWVDSVPGKLDADRAKLRISPRSPKSAWSAVNKAKVAQMRAEGRMQPSGEAMIAVAQANGMWTFLDEVDRLDVPEDLASALGDLRAVWDSWPRSVRRGTLEWIKTAKTAPTRAKRIADVCDSAGAGLRPSLFRR